MIVRDLLMHLPRVGTLNVWDQSLKDISPASLAPRWRFWPIILSQGLEKFFFFKEKFNIPTSWPTPPLPLGLNIDRCNNLRRFSLPLFLYLFLLLLSQFFFWILRVSLAVYGIQNWTKLLLAVEMVPQRFISIPKRATSECISCFLKDSGGVGRGRWAVDEAFLSLSSFFLSLLVFPFSSIFVCLYFYTRKCSHISLPPPFEMHLVETNARVLASKNLQWGQTNVGKTKVARKCV